MHFKDFFIKAAAITLAALLVIWYAAYSIEKAATNVVRNQIAPVLSAQLEIKSKIDELRNMDSRRVRLLGMTTFNPYVFYKVSQIKEQDRDLDGAIEEMELAMGLLNMWSTDAKMKKAYQERLDYLRSKK
jgi:hypothetical protein